MVTSKRVRLPQPSQRYVGAVTGPTVVRGPAGPLRSGAAHHLADLRARDLDAVHFGADRRGGGGGVLRGVVDGDGRPVRVVGADPVAGHEARARLHVGDELVEALDGGFGIGEIDGNDLSVHGALISLGSRQPPTSPL